MTAAHTSATPQRERTRQCSGTGAKRSQAARLQEQLEGKAAAIMSAATLLRRVRDAQGPDNYHIAFLHLRDALVEIPSATRDQHRDGANVSSWTFAGMVADLAAFGAKHVDLEAFIQQRIARFEADAAFLNRMQAEQRQRFVQRMREAKQRKVLQGAGAAR